MFQTEIHIFLQSLASDSLTAFFKFFSEIGISDYTVPFMFAVLFGIHFRSGLILIHLTFWTGILTEFYKQTFALPRPTDVDSSVQLLHTGQSNPTPFKGRGADSFFGALPRDVVEAFRSQVHHTDDFGFPSGHTSHAVALWGGISLFFKKTWVRIAAAIFLICIPLSRLYLGRHFLADVLGGYFLGLLLLLLFYYLVFQNEPLKVFLFEKIRGIRFNLAFVLSGFYFLLVPWLLLLVKDINPTASPTLLGLNAGFVCLWFRGLPQEGGTGIQRFFRVLLAIGIYLAAGLGFKKLAGLLFAVEPGIVEYFRQALAVFLLLWGSTEISIKLGLFKRAGRQS